MDEREMRLGDLFDDYCARCRLLLNHAVASMIDGHVVKVICQTCYTEHAYHHGKAEKKKASQRTTLFDQVLAKASPGDGEEEDSEESAPEKKPAATSRTSSRLKGKKKRGKSS